MEISLLDKLPRLNARKFSDWFFSSLGFGLDLKEVNMLIVELFHLSCLSQINLNGYLENLSQNAGKAPLASVHYLV